MNQEIKSFIGQHFVEAVSQTQVLRGVVLAVAPGHFVLRYFGKPNYTRFRSVPSLANVFFFESEEDALLFLGLNKAAEPPSRPETPAIAPESGDSPSHEGQSDAAAAAAPPAEANGDVLLEPSDEEYNSN